jgi:hypothetical protein
MSVITNEKDVLMVKCACQSHALEIMFDDDDKDCIPMIYMGIWTHGQRPLPLRWRERLRWIYYLIKDGRLHADDVIIDEKDALEVANFLEKKSKIISDRIRLFEEKKNESKKTQV